MNNVNENEYSKIKMIRNYIKDLSFENPQNINENNSVYNENSSIDVKMNVVYKPYNNNKFFSLILRYTFDCSSKHNQKKLFNLELDYFGFFEILEKTENNQENLTKIALKLLFPFVKEIIENTSKNGGSLPITLNEIDFNLTKN